MKGVPLKPVSINDYEILANRLLSKNAGDYYKSGAGEEFTLNLNKEAFRRLRIRPRMLRDVSNRSTSCTVQGYTLTAPIGVSPTAMQKMANEEGEIANARAVGNFGSIYTLSTLSTSSIEEVAEAAPQTIKWFQLYVYKDKEVTKKLIERAERAGFKAIVFTVDAPTFGVRYSDVRNGFKLPSHLKLKNVEDVVSQINITDKFSGKSGLIAYTTENLENNLSWETVKWLKSVTDLPIILKGILTAEDARIGSDLGVAGIIVSNHGGRQLDTCPASIEALPEIAKAVRNRCDIYLDGGIRYGTDVFKALALGAKMVFVGRPALWGLTCNGTDGVKHVLDLLAKEFDVAMALAGCSSVGDIKPEMVVHESYYSKL